jgi:hypothetical protein
MNAPAAARGGPGPSARGAGSDLQSLVALYHRTAQSHRARGAAVELEVRFHEIDFCVFRTILEALIAGERLPAEGSGPKPAGAEQLPTAEGRVVQTLNAIMPEEAATRRARHRSPQEPQKASLVREMTFAGGATTTRYLRKAPLAVPFRVWLPHAPPYLVAVSLETPLDHPFTSDRGAMIRVKSRASFEVRGMPWRVDLTVTRTVAGSDAASLPGILESMFRLRGGAPVVPATLLAALGLDGPDPEETQALYRYEIEIEHLPGGEAPLLLPRQVTEIAEKVLRLSDPRLLLEADRQAEVRRISGYLQRGGERVRRYGPEWTLKRLLPAVSSLSRVVYAGLYPPHGYFLLDKADGVRAIASAHGGLLRLLVVGGEMSEYPAQQGEGPPAGEEAPGEADDATTIVDGEFVGSGAGGVFHAFDVLVLEGENLTESGYEARVAHLGAAVAALGGYGLAAVPKPMVHLTASEPATLRAQFRDPSLADRPYETDGWILTQPGKPYLDTLAYKWKPPKNTTIDFLARRPPLGVLGRAPYVDAPGCRLHFLFTGIQAEMFRALGLEKAPGYPELFPEERGRPYFPVQFAPSDAPLAYLYQHPDRRPEGAGGEGWVAEVDGKILEMRCTDDCAAAGALGVPAWGLVRLRADRAQEQKSGSYFGNDYRVAELNWLNYVDPFPEEQLWEGVAAGYFGLKSALYTAQTAFVSFVKSRRISATLARAPWVVDLGVGRGADLGRYREAGVGHLVGVDADRGAISELVRRKFEHAMGKGQGKGVPGRGPPRSGPVLSALRADLLVDHAEVLSKVQGIPGYPSAGADAVVCNLAVHYFAGSAANLQNFAALCRGLVREGGHVVLTLFLGDRVHELLLREKVGPGEAWEVRQEGALKYALRRDYAEGELTPAGQQVGVLLPFSGGNLREEFLVNVSYLLEVFAARGFSEEPQGVNGSLGELLEEFRKSNASTFNRLTADDKTWVSLMGELLLRRDPYQPPPASPDEAADELPSAPAAPSEPKAMKKTAKKPAGR